MTEEDGVTAEGDITPPIIALTSLYSIASIQYSIFFTVLSWKQNNTS